MTALQMLGFTVVATLAAIGLLIVGMAFVLMLAGASIKVERAWERRRKRPRTAEQIAVDAEWAKDADFYSGRRWDP